MPFHSLNDDIFDTVKQRDITILFSIGI